MWWTAFLRAKESENDEIEVRSCLGHFGHELSVGKLRLTFDEKALVAQYVDERLDNGHTTQPGSLRNFATFLASSESQPHNCHHSTPVTVDNTTSSRMGYIEGE